MTLTSSGASSPEVYHHKHKLCQSGYTGIKIGPGVFEQWFGTLPTYLRMFRRLPAPLEAVTDSVAH